MSNKTLLVGVDAGDFHTVDRLAEAGEMPTLQSLMDQGFHAELESSVPPWTPTAWTSLTSGKNPGKHGIFDFKTTDQERLVNAGDVQTNRIWDYLTVENQTSIIVNVPVTHPAPEMDGILVPGYLGPETDAAEAYPEGIIEELQNQIGDYRVYKRGSYDSDEALCNEYIRLMKMRRDALVYLCDTYDWDFAMVQFQRTDTVFHELPDEQYINRVYSHADEYIGDIIDALDPDTTAIASDHGMGTTGDWDFRVNTWLQQEELLETSLNGLESGWKKPVNENDTEGAQNEDESRSFTSHVIRGLSKAGLTPQLAESLLARIGVDDLVKEIVPVTIQQQAISSGAKIDVKKSKAYCPSGPGLGIYCNDDVNPTVIEELRDITLPNSSKKLFEWVKPAETVFEGPHTETGPDVLMAPAGMDSYISATISASIFEPAQYRYNHKSDGILIAAGPSIPDSANRDCRSIYDIAPTILSMLDIPVDSAFDGDQIEFLLGKRVGEQEYQLRLQSQHSEEFDEIESRLEDLGYL